jgi:uncharacterized protein (DUF2126 family)
LHQQQYASIDATHSRPSALVFLLQETIGMGRAALLAWKDRDDGSSWAACNVKGQNGVVAVVHENQRNTVTVIFEVSTSGSATMEEAKCVAERWLERL